MGLGDKLRRLTSAGPSRAPVSATSSPTPEVAAAEVPAAETLEAAARSTTLDDLRVRMAALLAKTALGPPPPPPAADADDLPFVVETTEEGIRHRRVLPLPSSHRVGRMPILPSRTASSELLALLALDPSLASLDLSRALYLDTETTGLAGGAGTVAFLVGLASWEEAPEGPEATGGRRLVVEQLLVRNLGEEGPMLARVAERIRDASMLVTFNGKSFDLPLLRTRFVLARMTPPVEPPHLDLVHVARRLHKARGVPCRLTALEREVLGFERHDDVPSGEVAGHYLHFLRTGDARALLGVVEHNAWDVVAMAALVGLYGEPLEGSALQAPDLVGVARTLRRAGRHDDAWGAVNRAVESGGGTPSLLARAEIAKARGDRAQALADFEQVAELAPDPAVRLELAKLYEHYVKEPSRALLQLDLGTTEPAERASRRRRRLTEKVARDVQAPLPGVATRAGVRRRR